MSGTAPNGSSEEQGAVRPAPAPPPVGDPEPLVAVADPPHRAPVIRPRYRRSGGRPADRLGDERRHLFRSDPEDRLLQRPAPAARAGRALSAARAPAGV